MTTGFRNGINNGGTTGMANCEYNNNYNRIEIGDKNCMKMVV